MKQRTFSTIIVAAVTVAALSACGKQEPAKPVAAPAPAAGAPATPAAEEKPMPHAEGGMPGLAQGLFNEEKDKEKK